MELLWILRFCGWWEAEGMSFYIPFSCVFRLEIWGTHQKGQPCWNFSYLFICVIIYYLPLCILLCFSPVWCPGMLLMCWITDTISKTQFFLLILFLSPILNSNFLVVQQLHVLLSAAEMFNCLNHAGNMKGEKGESWKSRGNQQNALFLLPLPSVWLFLSENTWHCQRWTLSFFFFPLLWQKLFTVQVLVLAYNDFILEKLYEHF